MKRHSGLRMALLAIAMIVSEFGVIAEPQRLLLAADSACGPISFGRALKHYNVGLDLEVKRDLDGAIAEYRTAIRECSSFWRPSLNLAVVLEDRGDGNAAIAEYRAAIRGRKKFPEAHYHLGHALLTKGDIGGAIAEYRTAIRQRPNYIDAQSAIADALKAAGKS